MNNAVLSSFLAGTDGGTVLFEPAQADRITACLRALASHPDVDRALAEVEMSMHDQYWPSADSWQTSIKPYVVKQGVLHIPVKGVLLHNFPYSFGSYATGYYYIQKALERGLADPDVRGIALVGDTPGGHVAGCFELADKIYNARSQKPIQGFAHEHAYSAGYAILSAASKITTSRTGGVGSIGVVTQHMDWSQALEKAGVKITYVFAGKHKVDGNPNEPLSDDAKKRMQARIDETYGVFCASVARNRKLEEKAVRRTEALTFTAAEALENGLSDATGPFDEAMADFTACLHGTTGDDTMSEKVEKGLSQADLDSAVANARAEAAQAAKARISGIKALDEAKDRPAAAEAVAMETDMSVEAAKAFLAKMPKEAANVEQPKQTNESNPDFRAAMEGSQPGPGAGKEGEGEAALSEDDKIAARILGSRFGEAA